MARKIKRNIERNASKETSTKKKSTARKVIAGSLVVATLAGATALCLTNDRLQTMLGIGVEQNVEAGETQEQKEIKELKSQMQVLQESYEVVVSERDNISVELSNYKSMLLSEQELTAEQKAKLEEYEVLIESATSDKETIQSELEEYKSQLLAEKGITEEQATIISDYEKSIEEKNLSIANLNIQITNLQDRIKTLEAQLAVITNSVYTRVSTYAMKNDTANITNVLKSGNLIFLATNSSLEMLDITTGNQVVLDNATGSGSYCLMEIDSEVYVGHNGYFGKFDRENKTLSMTLVHTSAGLDSASQLLHKETNANGDKIMVIGSVLRIEATDGSVINYMASCYHDAGDKLYCAGITSSSGYDIYVLDKETLNITELNVSLGNTSYNFSAIRLLGDYLFYSQSSRNKHYTYVYKLSTSTSKSLSTSYMLIDLFEFDDNIYLILGTTLYKFNSEAITITSINTAFNAKDGIELISHSGKTFLTSNYGSSSSFVYDEDNKTFVKTSITSIVYSSLIKIGNYLFDKTLSYVYNDAIEDFQLCVDSANTNYGDYVVVDGVIIKTKTAMYFDEGTLTFEYFNYELAEYANYCNTNVLVVNGLPICSDSNSNYSRGVFYIDIESRTIKRFVDSGNGDILNSGYTYSSVEQLSDTTALVYGSSAKLGVIIDTSTKEVLSVFSNCGSAIIRHGSKVITSNGNYIKVLDTSNYDIKTLYSRESVPSADTSYIENNKLYFSTNQASTNVVLDLEIFDIEYRYGIGSIAVDNLRLGLHSSASSLYDPASDDFILMRGLSTAPTIYEFDDMTLFINTNMVYGIAKE